METTTTTIENRSTGRGYRMKAPFIHDIGAGVDYSLENLTDSNSPSYGPEEGIYFGRKREDNEIVLGVDKNGERIGNPNLREKLKKASRVHGKLYSDGEGNIRLEDLSFCGTHIVRGDGTTEDLEKGDSTYLQEGDQVECPEYSIRFGKKSLNFQNFQMNSS